MKETAPTSVGEQEISPIVYDRAKKLEEALTRTTIAHAVFDRHKAQGEIFAVRANDPDNTDPPGVPSLILDKQFLKGMGRVAFTLYKDLVDEGEQALATDLLSQDDHRRERYGVTSVSETPVFEPNRTSLSSERNR